MTLNVTGTTLIAQERERQIVLEGFLSERDATYTQGQLARAAQAYLVVALWQIASNEDWPDGEPPPGMWPWHVSTFKPSTDPQRNLVKSAALTAAEIDRLRKR